MRAAVWMLTLVAATPAAARANGLYTHIHVSQLAHAAVPPGELRDFLDDPEVTRAYELGSVFPDSGYAVDEDYGELAHWEPFLGAYLDWLRERHGGDHGSEEARRQIGFALGVASHGMADQSYDETLLRREWEVDGPEDDRFPVDQFADYFIVVDHDVLLSIEVWAPWMALAEAVERASGDVVPRETFERGMDLARAAVALQSDPAIYRGLYYRAWESYPWLGTHIYDGRAVGSLPWLGDVVAAYWATVWERLHDRDDPDADIVSRTVPADGETNWPVDGSESAALARIGVWLGYGVDTVEQRSRFRLEDDRGGEIAVDHATPYGGRERNLIFLVPRAPLAHDAVYTIVVDAGVTTLDGRTTTRPFRSSFRTRCAPDRLDDCPPLPPPLVTGEIPTRPGPPDAGPRPDAGAPDAGSGDDAGARDPDRPGSGCSLGRRTTSGAAAGVALLLLLRAPRRRR